MLHRVEPNASASARALPASMAGPSASVGGQPKAGEGPVTRAVLKIGPGSCLEVSISNHAGLVAALKQCVFSSPLHSSALFLKAL